MSKAPLSDVRPGGMFEGRPSGRAPAVGCPTSMEGTSLSAPELLGVSVKPGTFSNRHGEGEGKAAGPMAVSMCDAILGETSYDFGPNGL